MVIDIAMKLFYLTRQSPKQEDPIPTSKMRPIFTHKEKPVKGSVSDPDNADMFSHFRDSLNGTVEEDNNEKRHLL